MKTAIRLRKGGLMFRGMTTTSLIAIVALAAVGCKTSAPVTRMAANSSAIEVLSTSDRRSAMTDPKQDSTVTGSVKSLTADTKKNPRDVTALLNLAQLQLAQAKYDEADETAKRALRHDLKNREAKKILAAVAIRKQNYDLAEIILNGIGGARLKDSQVLNMLAMIALNRSQNQEALGLFKMAMKVDPSDIAVRMNLGVMYLKYRQLGEASVQFERVLKVMPEHVDAKLHLAIVRASRGQSDVAIAMYNDVLSKKKNNPLALFNLAVVQKTKEEYDDAIENLKAYIKTDYARKSDNDQVFALIESIQTEKAAKGEKVSDEEIQSLAAKLKQGEGGNDPSRPKEKSTREATNVVAPSADEEESEDIKALEKELRP